MTSSRSSTSPHHRRVSSTGHPQAASGDPDGQHDQAAHHRVALDQRSTRHRQAPDFAKAANSFDILDQLHPHHLSTEHASRDQHPHLDVLPNELKLMVMDLLNGQDLANLMFTSTSYFALFLDVLQKRSTFVHTIKQILSDSPLALQLLVAPTDRMCIALLSATTFPYDIKLQQADALKHKDVHAGSGSLDAVAKRSYSSSVRPRLFDTILGSHHPFFLRVTPTTVKYMDSFLNRLDEHRHSGSPKQATPVIIFDASDTETLGTVADKVSQHALTKSGRADLFAIHHASTGKFWAKERSTCRELTYFPQLDGKGLQIIDEHLKRHNRCYATQKLIINSAVTDEQLKRVARIVPYISALSLTETSRDSCANVNINCFPHLADLTCSNGRFSNLQHSTLCHLTIDQCKLRRMSPMRKAFPRLFSLHIKESCFSEHRRSPVKGRYRNLLDSDTIQRLILEEVDTFDISTLPNALKSLTLINTLLEASLLHRSAKGLQILSFAGLGISQHTLDHLDFAELPQLRSLRLHFMPSKINLIPASLEVTLTGFVHSTSSKNKILSDGQVQSLVLDKMRYKDQRYFNRLLASLTTVKRLTIKDHDQSHIKIDAQPFPASLEYLSLEEVLLRDPTKIHAAKHLESLKLNLLGGDANILAKLDLKFLPKLQRLIIVGSEPEFPAPKKGVHFLREL